MRAIDANIDANVVVRYLTGDHPEQAARARALIEEEPVFVPVTVAIETEWVLRAAYGYGAAEVAGALRAFGGLPGVTTPPPSPRRSTSPSAAWISRMRCT